MKIGHWPSVTSLSMKSYTFCYVGFLFCFVFLLYIKSYLIPSVSPILEHPRDSPSSRVSLCAYKTHIWNPLMALARHLSPSCLCPISGSRRTIILYQRAGMWTAFAWTHAEASFFNMGIIFRAATTERRLSESQPVSDLNFNYHWEGRVSRQNIPSAPSVSLKKPSDRPVNLQ